MIRACDDYRGRHPVVLLIQGVRSA
jgi:hypothetical protein